MPPFHPEPELDGLDFDLAAKNLEKPSFFDQVEAEREREMYMLAVVDEATGAPVRPATEEDLHDFPLELVAPLGPQAPPQPTAPKPPLCVKNMSLSELLAAATEEQGHPVCNHCGAQGGWIDWWWLGPLPPCAPPPRASTAQSRSPAMDSAHTGLTRWLYILDCPCGIASCAPEDLPSPVIQILEASRPNFAPV